MANLLNGVEYKTQSKALQNAIVLSNQNCAVSKNQVSLFKNLEISGKTQLVNVPDGVSIYYDFIRTNISASPGIMLRHSVANTNLVSYDDSAIILVTVKKFSDYISENFGSGTKSNLSYYPAELNTDYSANNANSYTYDKTKINVNGTIIADLWDDKYIVSSIIAYGGIPTESENRVLLDNYYVMLPLKANGYTYYRYSDTPYADITDDLDGGFLIDTIVKCFERTTIVTYNQMLDSNIVDSVIAPIYDLLHQTGDYIISGLNSGFISFATPEILANNQDKAYTFSVVNVFDSMDDITKFFNTIGIPWTYDQTAAETLPVDNPNFNPDYITNGQTTNPTGGGDGSGDNSNDVVTTQGIAQHYGTAIATVWDIPIVQGVYLDEVLWNVDFTAQAQKGLYTDIINAIVSLKYFPLGGLLSVPESMVQVAQTYLTYTKDDGSVIRVHGKKIGGIETKFHFSAGELQIEEYFGTGFDYAPYTKIDLFLPYIGFKRLNTNEIMNHLLKVEYYVDVISGGCLVVIYADDKIIDTASGTIGIDIPIAGSNRATTETMYNLTKAANTLNLVSSTGALATGIATKNPVSAAGGAISLGQSFAGALKSQIAAGQYAIAKASSVADMTSVFGVNTPYVIIERPITAYPANMAAQEGYPSNYGGVVSDFTGFLSCSSCDLTGITATAEELNEIDRFLKNGVFV